MKPALFLGVALSLLVPAAQTAQSAQAFDVLAISPLCSSEVDGAKAAEAPRKPPPLSSGFGNATFKVETAVPQAQTWFNFGLQLAWAFAHEDAKAAFAESMAKDPECGMCAWGYAWSLGPTINYGLDADQVATARVAAVKAQALIGKDGSERDRLLADALVRRYAPKGGDKAFAKAMQAIAARYPDDNVILTFTADSLMIGGQPAKAVPILEKVLATAPRDAGAIHFYIHATEWIGQPGRAETYADQLGGLAPGASHLIHMPSHTFYQIGRYKDAARVNLEAMDADDAWLKASGGTGDLFKIGYYGHNVRFALGGAMMAGDTAAALRIADHYGALDFAKANPWQQNAAAAAWFAYGRYGDVDKVLAMAGPAAGSPAQQVLWHYGRGEALARRGEAAGVRVEAKAIAAGRAALAKADREEFTVMADIAEQVLLGRAAMLEGDYRAAERHFRKAAERQEKVLGDYRDPPPWWYPVRRSYAAALLAQGRNDLALKEANKVLQRWPHDPMTLLVVSRAQLELGRTADAGRSLDAAGREWVGASLAATTPALI